MVKRESIETGAFALVTGASQGIGLAICEVLAKRKHNLLMISLPNEGLADAAAQLKLNHNIDVMMREIDLSLLDNCKELIEEIHHKQIRINILINNAGIGSNGNFVHFPPAFFEKQIAINCMTPVFLTRLLIPDMLLLPKAYILNIGSLGSFFDMPHKEVYVASKAFLYSFTRSLYTSLKSSNIHVGIICPGSVDSNVRMRTIHKSMKGIGKRSVMQPMEVAEIAIDGLFSGKRVFIPGKINQLLYWLNRMLPEWIQRYFVDREMDRQERLKQNVDEMLHTK